MGSAAQQLWPGRAQQLSSYRLEGLNSSVAIAYTGSAARSYRLDGLSGSAAFASTGSAARQLSPRRAQQLSSYHLDGLSSSAAFASMGSAAQQLLPALASKSQQLCPRGYRRDGLSSYRLDGLSSYRLDGQLSPRRAQQLNSYCQLSPRRLNSYALDGLSSYRLDGLSSYGLDGSISYRLGGLSSYRLDGIGSYGLDELSSYLLDGLSSYRLDGLSSCRLNRLSSISLTLSSYCISGLCPIQLASSWFRSGHPVPKDYLAPDAQPSSLEWRRYQEVRGPGDGRRPPLFKPPLALIGDGGWDDGPGESDLDTLLQPQLPIPDRPAASTGAGESPLLLEPIPRFARSPCCAPQNRPAIARLALVKPRHRPTCRPSAPRASRCSAAQPSVRAQPVLRAPKPACHSKASTREAPP